MKTLVDYIAEYLLLEKPLDIRILTKKRGIEHCGDYLPVYNDSGLLKKHRINVYLNNMSEDDNNRSFWDIIAHELIHAWQEENGIESDKAHCDKFINMASKVRRRFMLPGVYLADRDVT